MVDTYVSGAYGFSVWVQVPSPTFIIRSIKYSNEGRRTPTERSSVKVQAQASRVRRLDCK